MFNGRALVLAAKLGERTAMNTEKQHNTTASGAPEAPTLAELQVQETLAINRLQHLENAIGEIQHLKRSVYDLTESGAKVARHAEKLAEALRKITQTESWTSHIRIAREALAAYEEAQS